MLALAILDTVKVLFFVGISLRGFGKFVDFIFST